MSSKGSEDTQALNEESQAIWNKNAAFWDEAMGEGNQFQRVLIGPATERLLNLRAGERVLDVACGNGVFSRRLAQLGAEVVACDFSGVFLERAKQRAGKNEERIEYSLVDVTEEAQLLSLGENRFDAVVCNMALMDIPTLTPLARALPRILKNKGRFVFSILHPCFNTSGCKMVIEQEDIGGELVTTYAVKVSNYTNLAPAKGLGIEGQPTPHYYFNRPISRVLNTFFNTGFALTGLEEPTFGLEDAGSQPFSWANYKDIPPVLVARLHLLAV